MTDTDVAQRIRDQDVGRRLFLAHVDRDAAREGLAAARAEIERLKRCYATATGKAHGCGSGAVVRIECKQMSASRVELERLRSIIAGLLEGEPYEREPLNPGRECAYCGLTWDYSEKAWHADTCPVTLGRAAIGEDGT